MSTGDPLRLCSSMKSLVKTAPELPPPPYTWLMTTWLVELQTLGLRLKKVAAAGVPSAVLRVSVTVLATVTVCEVPAVSAEVVTVTDLPLTVAADAVAPLLKVNWLPLACTDAAEIERLKFTVTEVLVTGEALATVGPGQLLMTTSLATHALGWA